MGVFVFFPVFYEPGVISGSSLFTGNTEHFLNCHIYPNNIAGSGIIEMEITTNSTHKDTIIWSAIAVDNLFLNEPPNPDERIANIYNLEGKVLPCPVPNEILLIEYASGVIQKRIVVQ